MLNLIIRNWIDMSLFNLRDFCNVQCGSEEDYDQNSLCIANIDNNPNGTGKSNWVNLKVKVYFI